MKRFLVAVLMISAMLSAAYVDQTKAQKVAENYYQNYAPASAKGNTVQKIQTKTYNGQATWYAVSFNQGFVIVSADDAVRSILGYSYKGEMVDDLYNMQNPFINRFDAYDKQIVEARETGYVDTKAQTEWKNIENNIFPKASKAIIVDTLVESRWGQGWPMNDLCPLDGGVETAVGCVATAMHQIMRYHMAPLNGISSHSYFWTGSSSSGTLAVTFADFSYDYDLMPLNTSSVTTAELDELSKLSYHAGVSVDMDYDIFANGGSGAYSTDVPYALETYFGFSTDATYVSVGSPTDPTTQSTNIQTDLDNGRPIYWSGSGVDGGHAFVLDGYTDDYYYHFNWGWNGSSDGWFQLTSLNPNSDFTSSQGAVYQIWSTESLFLEWPTPTNLGGTVANMDDVTLTWTAPTASPNATLTGYRVFRESVEIATTNASTTSYLDADLSAGYYNYTVKATYTGPDGESHISNNYYVAITADENYPIPLYVEAEVEAFTRQDVDLTWTKPFTLAIYFQEDFETTSFETDWLVRRTTNEFGARNDNFNSADADPNWIHCDEATYGDAQYIHSGLYSATCPYVSTSTEWEWLFSPFITLGANSELRYWIWSYGTDTHPGKYDINLYDGDMTERDPSGNVYNIVSYTNIDAVTYPGSTNTYETEVIEDLSAYTGSYRLAITRQLGMWQFCVDDIIVAASSKRAPGVNPNVSDAKPVLYTGDVNSADITGLPSIKSTKAAKADEPLSYDIYRNGSFVTNVAVTGATEVYSDTGFIDGYNEYYVKALYPASGSSIASNRSTAFMDANPKPDYLTGILNGTNDVDLAWYKPYHNAPMWYTYAYEADSYYDYLEGYLSLGFKTRFLGSELGYFYPVTVDSICAAFGEYTDVPWTNNQFTFTINTRATDGTDSILWGPSGNLTAVDGEFTTVAVPSLVMNTYWYVVVTPGDTATGHPAIITDIHDEPGASSESTTWIDNQVDTEGWYGIIFGDEGYPGDWMIMSYVTSSASPDITKSGWVSSEITEKEIPQLAKKIVNDVPEIESKAKGMTNYNIYRNGSLLGTSGTLTYTDLNPLNGDNTYYITALYDNPVGESLGSNSVVINVAGGPTVPAVPANVVTSISGSNLVVDWDVSADATGYDVYSSDDPYGTFTFVASVATNQYTVAASQAKLFYYIIATNATKK